MQLFYVSQLNQNQTEITLDKEESYHLMKVLRKKEGNKISLTNGRGLLAEGIIASLRKEVVVDILSENNCSKTPLPNLAVAPPKSIDRMLWLVEKATELGVDSITPLCCDHSERRKINIEKLQKTAISAMKQSKRVYLPKINPMTSFSEFLLQNHDFIGFGACNEKLDRKPILEIDPIKSGYFLIGPEGDFSKTEIEQLIRKKIQPFSLGNYILRTETAAVSVCQTYQILKT